MQQSSRYGGWRIVCVEFGLSYKLLGEQEAIKTVWDRT